MDTNIGGKMVKISFVILHYEVLEYTIDCVKSIKEKIDVVDYNIIIVDNNSKNNSGEVLKEMFKNDKKIEVILNTENLGFARGNNIGFKFAKENFNPEFIVLLNNDTCIIQDNFYSTIKAEYDFSDFALLGPKIHLLDDAICPVRIDAFNITQVKREILKLKRRLLMNYIFPDNFIHFLKKILKVNKKDGYVEFNEKNANERLENIVIQGCCMIFSNKYISKFDGLDDRTFMYCEEDILYIRLKRNNMLSVYNPNLHIFHAESIATNVINDNKRNKRLFIYKELLKSFKILLSDLEEKN